MRRVETLSFAGVVWVAAVGCTGSVPSTAQEGVFTDGTRLKAVVQQADGAPPLFLGWYDTELGVDCTFQDVGLRDRLVCFPSDPVGSVTFGLFAGVTSLFTDDGCSEPLVNVAFPPCENRFFARWPEPRDPCGTPAHLYPVGAVVASDPASLYDNYHVGSGVGACEPATPAQLESVRELHRLGPEIPLDALVSGTYHHGTGPGRIVPVTIVGSDGSVQVDGTTAWDTERHEIVSASLGASLGAGSRWYPAARYQTGLFSDAACTVPGAVGSACQTPANEGYAWATDACGQFAPTSYFELGVRLAVDPEGPYYTGPAGDACLPTAPLPDPTIATFSVGAPIAPTVFADATQVLTGSNQLQLIRAGSADGPPTYSVGFFDVVHGQPCSILPSLKTADGTVRCLPSTTDTFYFADDACSVPIVVLDQSPSACAPRPAFVSLTESEGTSTDGCYTSTARRHIYPVGEPYLEAVYDRVGPGECLGLGSAADTALYLPGTVYATGPEIPAGDFATVSAGSITSWR